MGTAVGHRISHFISADLVDLDLRNPVFAPCLTLARGAFETARGEVPVAPDRSETSRPRRSGNAEAGDRWKVGVLGDRFHVERTVFTV